MLDAHKRAIVARIEDALAPLVAGTDVVPDVVLERPKTASHGDLATNVAMQVAKRLRRNPREIAQVVVDALASDELGVERAEMAGPGFVNLFIAPRVRQAVARAVLEQGPRFGIVDVARDGKTMVEFVSANPTGPLHVGHARQGALGDVIAALLQSQGHAVTREYYYNDAGVQIATLVASVQARARGLVPDGPGWPAAAYKGEYIGEIAADFVAKRPVDGDGDGKGAIESNGDIDDDEAVRRYAVAYLRREQDLDLKAFGVAFDHYYLESSLYADGRVERAVAEMVASGRTYEADGALWLATTSYPDLGDDKDRVMRKSDGTYTYFVPDVAYHLAKWERGFHQVINVQGSDHHGTVARVRAGLRAISDREHLGLPAIYPDYVLHKMVRVMRGGEEVKISKRAGSYVALRDLIQMSGGEDEPNVRGRDAVRFFMISRKADTEFTFDVDLALSRSDENPVYYVQYAHARICSVLEQWAGDGWDARIASLVDADLSPLVSTHETALLQRLSDYPAMLAEAAHEFAPHQVAFWLRDAAADLHSYYNAERVLVDDPTLRTARLALLAATRQVLSNGLDLVGVSAPRRM